MSLPNYHYTLRKIPKEFVLLECLYGEFLFNNLPEFLRKSVRYVMAITNALVIQLCGPGSVVDITTGYGLEGPAIESR
jgi:hypothetical protein